jgi:uncharacterized protein
MQSLVLDASPANIRRALAFSVLWIVLLPVNVMAASFDCKKGQTFVEQAICSHQRLSTLDNQLAKAYQRALDIAFAPDQPQGGTAKLAHFRQERLPKHRLPQACI